MLVYFRSPSQPANEAARLGATDCGAQGCSVLLPPAFKNSVYLSTLPSSSSSLFFSRYSLLFLLWYSSPTPSSPTILISQVLFLLSFASSALACARTLASSTSSSLLPPPPPLFSFLLSIAVASATCYIAFVHSPALLALSLSASGSPFFRLSRDFLSLLFNIYFLHVPHAPHVLHCSCARGDHCN